MKVAVIDFDHYEMTYSLLKCLAVKAIEIDVYANKPLLKLLQSSNLSSIKKINWILTDNGGHLSQIFLHRKLYDFVFFNTLDTHFDDASSFLETLNKSKTILTIHNVNFWFLLGTRFKIFKRPRSIQHKDMLQITKKVNGFLVISESIQEYLKTKVSDQKIIVFPSSIFEGVVTHNQKTSSQLEIVIPGAIEIGRKNYSLALDVLKMLDKDRFRLNLLGMPKKEYGAAIVSECKKMQTEGFNIQWSDHYIEPSDYEIQISKADVLFAPVNVTTRYRGIDEIYGQSKETGAIFDLIRYSKPGIFPSQLRIPDNLKEAVITYSDINELKNVFNRLLDKRYLNSLTQNAKQVSQKYTCDVVAEDLYDQMLSVL